VKAVPGQQLNVVSTHTKTVAQLHKVNEFSLQDWLEQRHQRVPCLEMGRRVGGSEDLTRLAEEVQNTTIK